MTVNESIWLISFVYTLLYIKYLYYFQFQFKTNNNKNKHAIDDIKFIVAWMHSFFLLIFLWFIYQNVSNS